MIRPPSNIRAYDDFFTGDPAFIQVSDDATEAAKAEHANKIRVARETGNWSALQIDGQSPTKFVMKPLTGTQFRNIVDSLVSKAVGGAIANQLAFRAAIVEIVNGGDLKIGKKVNHTYLDMIAPRDLTDALDAIDTRIVNELGGEALRRAQEIPPKSSRD